MSFIADTIKDLKTDYGMSVELIRKQITDPTFENGYADVEEQRTTIRKAIVLTETQFRQMLSIKKRDDEPTAILVVLLDADDTEFQPDQDDYINVWAREYRVIKAESLGIGTKETYMLSLEDIQ